MDATAKPNMKRRIYGRRLGRPLSDLRQNALDALLPELSVPAEIMNLPDAAQDPKMLFSRDVKDIWVEIGFGDGEHLARLTERYPENGFIGAEPFINGMSGFLKTVDEDNLDQERLRVWMDDAILMLDKFSDASVQRIYVLNPDPWPKARHYKRRIISQKNLDLFARILVPGGLLIMSTDVDDLAEWMVTQSVAHPLFGWTAERADDWRTTPPDWVETRYEQKGRAAGRTQTYLFFERLAK